MNASGLQLLRSESTPIRVSLMSCDLVLRRTAKGRLEVQDYLPERKGPAGVTPFSIRADGSHIRFIDESPNGELSHEALLHSVAMDGVGNEWIAGGIADIDRVGQVSASVQSIPGRGIYVKGESHGLDLSSVLAEFRRTREGAKIEPLRHFTAASVRASGPFEIVFPETSALDFSLQVHALASNFAYDGYRFNSGSFSGVVGEDGLAGKGDASAPGLSGAFDGSLHWRDSFALGTQLNIRSPDLKSSPQWLRNLIPKEIQLRNGTYRGWLAYDRSRGLVLDANLTGSEGVAYGESLTQPNFLLHVDRQIVRLGDVTALWHGSPVQGSLEIGLRDHKLAGAFSSPNVDLRTVAARFDQPGLKGLAEAKVIIGGTTSALNADFEATGTANYKDKVSGRFEAAGRYADRVLVLTRGLAETKGGTLVVDGRLGSDQSLGMRVEAANLTLAPFVKGAEGTGSFKGRLAGTLKNPRAEGDLQAYGLRYQGHTLPFLSAHLASTGKEATLTKLVAQQGPTEATGEVTYRYSNGALVGKLEISDLQPGEFLGEDFVGLVDLPNITIGGTVKNPRATAVVQGSDLFFQGRRLNNFRGALTLNDQLLKLDSLSASLFDGSVTATGAYNVKRKTGAFDLVLTNLGLAKLAELPADFGRVEGRLNGTAKIEIDKNNTLVADAQGALDNVVYNNTHLGGGNFDLSSRGSIIRGSAQVGNLEGYQRIDSFAYNRDTQDLTGKLLVANTPLFDLYRATRRFYPDLPQNVNQILRGTAGTLNLEASISGRAKDPNVNLQVLDVTDLMVLGRQLGELKISGQRAGEVYQDVDVALRGPSGNLNAKGSVDPNGPLKIDADVSGFDLSLLGIASDSLSALRGRVSSTVVGSGSSRDPVFHATLASQGSTLGVTNADGTVSEILDFGVDLNSIDIRQSTLSPDGIYRSGIEASGLITFRGLQGTITANVPLLYPFKIPENSPLIGAIDLPETQLTTLHALIPGMDIQHTTGSLAGHIGIHGPLDGLLYDGNIDLLASHLGFEGVQDRFHDVAAKMQLLGNDIHLDGTALADSGGTLKLNSVAKTPGVRRLIEELQAGPLDEFWSSPLSGALAVDALKLNETTPGAGTVSGTTTGNLLLGGTMKEPLISGKATLSNGKIVLPTKEIVPSNAPEFALDPRFDIQLAITRGLNVRSSNANVDLGGAGSIGGSLKNPQISADLKVQKGTFQLPTARVTLEPDGTIRPSYHPGSPDGRDARIDVDLEGRTRVTATGFNNRPQLYDIRLGIRGDLLQDNGLTLSATSNPGDLDNDQIIALLGQTQAIQGLTGIGAGGTQAENRIRAALAGTALPYLLDPLTGKLGQALGLESLTLTYDLQNQASIYFAKALGKNFTVSYSRQLTSPFPGQKTQYDIELSYRNPKLRRFTFSIGADQDRPYKLSVEYGFRF